MLSADNLATNKLIERRLCENNWQMTYAPSAGEKRGRNHLYFKGRCPFKPTFLHVIEENSLSENLKL
jgi:hypothetical protein